MALQKVKLGQEVEDICVLVVFHLVLWPSYTFDHVMQEDVRKPVDLFSSLTLLQKRPTQHRTILITQQLQKNNRIYLSTVQ